MEPLLQQLIRESSFHITTDLAPLFRMLKVMSVVLSPKARLRLAWMDEYRRTPNAAEVCRRFGIPLRTFWYWESRYDPWDLRSLEERSRKPHQSPRRIPRATERALLTLKQEHPRWGVAKLPLVLARRGIVISPMTCWRILKRHARIVPYRTRKHRAPKPRINWAEIRLPGDLLQLDVKYGRDGGGHRVYQYTVIEVITKWRHLEVHRHANMRTTIQFLTTVLRVAPCAVRCIQTDNGPEFGQSVTAWLRSQNIRHVFSHKHRPQENAYVERSHRTDEEEFWSQGSHGVTFADLRAELETYLRMYNEERPHWGLQGKTPAEALASYSLPEPCKMS